VKTPLYFIGVQGCSLEFDMISQQIKSCFSKDAKGAIRVLKRRGWNALCADLSRVYYTPLTWGISLSLMVEPLPVLEELQARSFASTKRIALEVAKARI